MRTILFVYEEQGIITLLGLTEVKGVAYKDTCLKEQLPLLYDHFDVRVTISNFEMTCPGKHLVISAPVESCFPFGTINNFVAFTFEKLYGKYPVIENMCAFPEAIWGVEEWHDYLDLEVAEVVSVEVSVSESE